MIPIALLDFLIEEIKSLFQGQTFKNPDGSESPMNVFAQYLPLKNANTPDTTKVFPHIRIILVDGEDPDEDTPHTCRVAFQVGVYDAGLDRQGFRDVSHIIQVIYEHLMENRLFGRKYEVDYPFKWSFYEEDLFPYFYGEIETNWTMFKVTIQDDLT